MKSTILIFVIFLFIVSHITVADVLAASGGTRVVYNCVNGTNSAKCAGICENMRVMIGLLPNPYPNVIPFTESQKQELIQFQIPYYCDGIPVTAQQKAFVGVSDPTPTLIPTEVPTQAPSITQTIIEEASVMKTPETIDKIPSQQEPTSILHRIASWLRNLWPW